MLLSAVPRLKLSFATWVHIALEMLQSVDRVLTVADVHSETEQKAVRKWVDNKKMHSLIGIVSDETVRAFSRRVYDMRRDRVMRARGNWIERFQNLEQNYFPRVFDWMARLHFTLMKSSHWTKATSCNPWSPFHTVHVASRYSYIYTCYGSENVTEADLKVIGIASYILASQALLGTHLSSISGITPTEMASVLKNQMCAKRIQSTLRSMRKTIKRHHEIFLGHSSGKSAFIWNQFAFPYLYVRTSIDIIPYILKHLLRKDKGGIAIPHKTIQAIILESNYRADLCAGDIRSSVASPTRMALASVVTSLQDFNITHNSLRLAGILGVSERLAQLDNRYIRVVLQNANRIEIGSYRYDSRCVCPNSFIVRMYRNRRLNILNREATSNVHKRKSFPGSILKSSSRMSWGYAWATITCTDPLSKFTRV